MKNKMELRFPGISANEGFARVCAAAFASQLDPTLEEVADIKTAISRQSPTPLCTHMSKGAAKSPCGASF